MTPANEPKADLAALTGARGIAAWFVVLYHVRVSAAALLPPEAAALLSKGYLAVDFFFMLSGFVIYLNYGERLKAEGWRSAPRFLARRIARIWPLHLFILGGAALFAATLWAAGKPNPEQFPWGELPLHLLLAHVWGFTNDLTWNDPSWSISGEWAAYLLFPLLLATTDWRRAPTYAVILIAAVAATELYLLFRAAESTILDEQIPRLGLARAILEFTIGMLLCVLWQRHRGPRAFAIAAGSLLLFGALWTSGLAGETAAGPATLAALLFLLALTAGWKLNPLASRPAHYLGEISYSTYLVHFLGFVAFKILFVEEAHNLSAALLGLFLALILAASILLHHLVERPAQRALNRTFDSWLTKAAARRTDLLV